LKGRFEGDGVGRKLQALADFVLIQVETIRQLRSRHRAAQLLFQLRAGFAQAVDGAYPVQRHVEDARLLGQALQDRLADPPHRVADELEMLGLVEALGRPDQSQVPLVDQIRHRQSLVLVIAAYGDHEFQVGADELVQRAAIPLADTEGQIGFLAQGQVLVLADFPEV